MSAVKMEAYLGPNRPETLASGMGEDGSPVAVVRCWPESDRTEWVGAYATTEDALGAVREATNDETYGVLCSTRKVH
ncbi:hypothetical protein SEA_KINGBOB_44 [Arthrobacter phage KingBob]|uniref:Uncharacterized protein n=1 Tax=Arthrobacter phage Sergei TaxID=2250416 RepID=A0A345KPY2_9CAUD|nr:hypothetical protein KDJ06_gp44 [Arthrobacter phage Sergei]ASZ74358.1 hypothetical protein TEMPER16_44 [Arthrobacter phage Temper16]AXH43971.1 hypothetical protein SEA_DAIBOJU_44 [Arthrobacter phage Daiboju]AXH44033.1 hypothetical protein SEA_HERB_44 [Arthrobacter phage Herb]AXH44277.1 hypothetical protein SEA_KINGBOB_44 [Arthrobacter phage KingBob]QGJ97184.1 hypothetical protein SEA_MARIA1952_43 [Arthrobacter phage Maria1952]